MFLGKRIATRNQDGPVALIENIIGHDIEIVGIVKDQQPVVLPPIRGASGLGKLRLRSLDA